jgi:putative DNA primase/helicase
MSSPDAKTVPIVQLNLQNSSAVQRPTLKNHTAAATADALAPVISEDRVALEFVDRHKDAVRYNPHEKLYFIWNGFFWKRDDRGVVFNWVRELAREFGDSARANEQQKIGRAAFCNGVEQHARTDQRIVVTSEQWDENKYLLGTPDGTIDLKECTLRKSRPADLISRVTAVAPASTPSCSLWHRFLHDATGDNAELIRFLQQFIGYCLSGDTREQVLVFLYGLSGTGKTVFVNTVLRLMGDYACAASMETFTFSRFDQHPEELARLHGARVVIASETEAGRKWRENRIKQLTGGDLITARYMRENSFSFRPQFKLLFVGNHAPTLINLDGAIRRRFLVVRFDCKPETPDCDLEEKLRAEGPEILRWAMEGFLDWQKNGLTRPAAVTKATEQYFEDQDSFSEWISEKCNVGYGLSDTSKNLQGSWRSYQEENGEKPDGRSTFYDRLRAKGCRGPKQLSAFNKRGFEGIQLKASPSYHEPIGDRE